MASIDRLPLVTIRNAEILPGSWRNFAGEERFNQKKRTFNIKLPADVALAMKQDGFNVKELKAREEEDEPGYRIEVAVSYENRPPQVWMISGGQRVLLDETSISVLDYLDIAKADVKINPYQWETATGSGVKAYLDKLYVTAREDDLDAEYSSIPVSGGGHRSEGVQFEDLDS